jgi:ribonucleoside-diphosphate reductase alpha chain
MSAQPTQPAAQQLQPGARQRLEPERRAVTHKFQIAGHKGYLTVGLYPDGRPGEIFLRMAKVGSTLAGLLDAFAISVSLGLQHNISLQTFAAKFIDTRFEPMGFTGNQEIPEAASIMDYIFRYLMARFPAGRPQ